MMVIGNEYEVIIGEEEFGNGEVIKIIGKLERIENYKGLEIYIFVDEDFDRHVMYKNMNEKNIDWDFIKKARFNFGI